MANQYKNKVVYDGNTLIDLTGDTATAADVAQGKTFHLATGEQAVGTASSGGGSATLTTKTITANGTYSAEDDNADGYSEVTVNVPSSGGGAVTEKMVNFIDYDGTLLYSYSAAEFAELSALPANPSHSGLTAQGWNWTLAQITSQLAAMPTQPVWVGQMYVTDDDKTRIYVHFEEARKSPYLGICPNGTVTVDWGDGTSTDTLTGTSLITVKHTPQHEYTSGGDYVITLTAASGTTFAFYGVSITSHILKKDTGTTANVNRVYANAVKKVELGSAARLGAYAFTYCMSLETITMPSTITSIGTYAFQYCYSLTNVVIPDGVTSIGTYAFQYCYSLTNVVIPNRVTSIGTYVFRQCYSLTNVVIPDGVTSIGNYAFYACYALANVVIPNGVTSIGTYAFSLCDSLASLTIPDSVTSIVASTFASCRGIAEYHFKPTTPPTLANTNAFSSIQSDCKIYVPYSADHSILEAYQTATNWSTYASYMVEEDAA